MKKLCCLHDYAIYDVMSARFLVKLCLSVAYKWNNSGSETPCILYDGTRHWT